MTNSHGKALIGLLLAGAGMTAPLSICADTGERRAFLACPVVQDTDSVPCWLASDGHSLYYLGIQIDISASFHPPQLKHKVLVEGTISDEPPICGGIVLKPVTLSVMPEVDLSCDTILPTTDYSIIDPPRGPGPSNRGKRIATDASFVAAPSTIPREQPPFTQRQFAIPFSFNSLYMDIHAFSSVLQAAHYAQAIHASRFELTGYRGSVRLPNKKMLTEKNRIAELRARKVKEALEELDPGLVVVARWASDAEAPERSPDSRRVDVTVFP